MRICSTFLLLCVLLLVNGCSDEPEVMTTESENEYLGSWLFVEYGYSPGAGYIIEAVSPIPPKTITFLSDEDFLSNIEGLKDYRFYSVSIDEYSDLPILKLYKHREDILVNSPDAPSFNLVLNNNELKLLFRYCYEGCHSKFIKLGATHE
jgi:hypothetical protein